MSLCDVHCCGLHTLYWVYDTTQEHTWYNTSPCIELKNIKQSHLCGNINPIKTTLDLQIGYAYILRLGLTHKSPCERVRPAIAEKEKGAFAWNFSANNRYYRALTKQREDQEVFSECSI